MPNRAEVTRWAEAWIELWNGRDVEALLEHYRDDVRFESPMAEALAGSALVEGKVALRRFWTLALDRFRDLHVDLERVLWDPEQNELAIVYRAALDGRHQRACELVTFDAFGKVIRGEACYGVRQDGEQVGDHQVIWLPTTRDTGDANEHKQ